LSVLGGVLRGVEHEIIVVDDSSLDGTYKEACRWTDRAVLVKRAGQTRGLLTGIKAAQHPVVVTLDVDLENPPELIPTLLKVFMSRGFSMIMKVPAIALIYDTKTLELLKFRRESCIYLSIDELSADKLKNIGEVIRHDALTK